MEDFKKTNSAGRGIATLFSNVGWGIAAVGLLLAIAGFVLGAIPGSGGSVEPVTVTGRLGAAGLGIAVALFGLFSVMMAAQTRAALDTADMTLAMLKVARSGRSAAALTASKDTELAREVPATQGQTPSRSAMEPAPVREDQGSTDDIPAMPVNLRSRLVAPIPQATTPTTAGQKGGTSRTEPPLKPAAKAPQAAPKPHPIFSAKPPR